MIAPNNKSLDASGGSVFRNFLGAAEGALIRAVASTQPFGVFRQIKGIVNQSCASNYLGRQTK